MEIGREYVELRSQLGDKRAECERTKDFVDKAAGRVRGASQVCVDVQVPLVAKPGAGLLVPWQDKHYQVYIPVNAKPGESFQVTLPISAPPTAADLAAEARLEGQRRRMEQLEAEIKSLEARASATARMLQSKRGWAALSHRAGMLMGREVGMRRSLKKCNAFSAPVAYYKRLKHMKTVNGHLANPVYCLVYDNTGRFIFTAADDRSRVSPLPGGIGCYSSLSCVISDPTAGS